MNTLDLLKDKKEKIDFIQNIPQIFKNYTETHDAYFFTITFQNSFGNQKEMKSGEYERVFSNLYVHLNEVLFSKKINKFFKPIMILMPEESLKLHKAGQVSIKNRFKIHNGIMNTHYHGVLFIHKTHANKFCEAFVRKTYSLCRINGKPKIKIRNAINWKSFRRFSNCIYSTDIQSCPSLEDVQKAFSYSSKKFTYRNIESENFDMDDVFIFTSGLTHIQQIINSYMHFNDIKPFSNYMKSKQFTHNDMCEW